MGGVPAHLTHVTITAADFAASLAFYDAALGALGLQRSAEFGDEEEDEPQLEAAGWSAPAGHPLLWLVAGTVPTRGAHVALQTGTRRQVEAFHAAALASGGRAHTAPRRWLLYRRGEFTAAVLDPADHLVEAITAE
jgi:catechol 2,3-dioxygenase-like lactoylglutathione lyase family enzyme